MADFWIMKQFSALQGLEVRHNNIFFLWLFYLFRFLGRLCACLLNFFYLFEWCKLWLKYQLTFSNLYRKKIQIKKYLEDFLKRDNGNEKRRRIRIERDHACRVTFVSRYIFRQTSGLNASDDLTFLRSDIQKSKSIWLFKVLKNRRFRSKFTRWKMCPSWNSFFFILTWNLKKLIEVQLNEELFDRRVTNPSSEKHKT